jgi:hypothetical protein
MSASTNNLKSGISSAPVVGPAHTVFANWLINPTVNVPDVVIGVPVTVNTPLGTVIATDVTVPLPAPLVGVKVISDLFILTRYQN